MTPNEIFDLAIIGGGINGCGIARDAAGRGLNVLLVEQDDIASATSSWSSKMVHGGLRYLEQYEFKLVRESLQEREVLLRLAPHLIHPAEFIVPHDASMRPAWMVRLGLLLYDHIGGKISLPRSRTISFPDASQIYDAGLKAVFPRGFFYSDTRVDDARLTLVNALSARNHGADIRPRTRCIFGKRSADAWMLTLQDARSGQQSTVSARGVVNAVGPWVEQALTEVLQIPTDARVKLVKGSHIVVPRIHSHAHAYLLQNTDKRVIFVIPFEEKFSLIGTTDVAITGIAEGAAASVEERRYLLRAVNRYLASPLLEKDIVWDYAGVRPLYDDGTGDPSKVTRDYVLKVDDVDQAGKRQLPLLSIFGGKITTYRRLAEHALADLVPYFPEMSTAWTHTEKLPGADFEDRELALMELQRAHTGLPPDYLAQLFKRHGSTARVLLKGVCGIADLGECFGNGAQLLSEREIDFCIREEWAMTGEDILWRRTKCGLHMDAAERERANAFIESKVKH